MKSLSPYL